MKSFDYPEKENLKNTMGQGQQIVERFTCRNGSRPGGTIIIKGR